MGAESGNTDCYVGISLFACTQVHVPVYQAISARVQT